MQANYNLKYAHKSWIVLPEEKAGVIQNKYYTHIRFFSFVMVHLLHSPYIVKCRKVKNAMQISERIKRVREYRKITQKELEPVKKSL